MIHRPKHPAPFPTKQQLLDFIRETPGEVGKREIARAFHIGPADKQALKVLMREMVDDGMLERGRKRRVARPGALSDTVIVEVTGTDTDGELIAKPIAWEQEGRPPRILLAPERRGQGGAIGVGDRVLAKLRRINDHLYEARPIRRLAAEPSRVLGVFEPGVGGDGRLLSVEKRDRAEYMIGREDAVGLQKGELVLAELLPGRHYGMRLVKPVERLGDMKQPRAVSLIAIHARGIPAVFPESTLKQAEDCKATPLGEREDLRQIPLVTIDGEDARDFDDAVFAEPDTDPKNPGGWRLLVAIADVAWYVRTGDALDSEARKRGNSVYFPDRVVPMLPEALSNGWCSLKPDEDRGTMAVRITIDADGNILRHAFTRGLMRSAARLTYEQVEAAHKGNPGDAIKPLMARSIEPLFGAFACLMKARERRGVLDLNVTERKVLLDNEGRVTGIVPRQQLDSHRLIEEFMIAANVAVAETLEKMHLPCMYRVHAEPAQDKLESLREFLSSMSLNLAKGQHLTPAHFNQILAKVKGTPNEELVNQVVLRSQAQAIYAPENVGHFGLNLRRYAHFTSPIRRYADLLVHRALIKGLKAGGGALQPDEMENFAATAEHISGTERRAAAAERDAIDRYTALFLSDRVGALFEGRIGGVTRFGLFVTLADTGADGLVMASSLPGDYYVHDERSHSLIGRRTRKAYRLGDPVTVRLMEAVPVTGGLRFEIVKHSGPKR
ncbi:Ribonuclease R [Rhodospirillaceae bacterium LM-1]|nr:Ribonuclease R [Rhodospirillaceae bacterium LM-1]